ncbi:SART-1 protein [Lipomyces chichibuensis]|uniref:SART-1 protein n=1 Tax=Lipomyces chichibuensis TaxID=1546026 RepID=UPI0033442A32
MADRESNLSIEETNRRRIEMGLRPIPVPDDALGMKSKLLSKEDATGVCQDESSLSLEETNKLRISLGLRPIPVPGDEGMGASSTAAPAPDSDELALANWRAKYETEKKSAELEATRRRIQKAKERIERLKYLDGRSLGEQDEDNVDDVRKWVKRSKKKVKISIPEDDDEQEEMKQYTAEDLKGLKVGHSLEDIMDGEDVILTLKDRNVLDEGEDELVSLALEEHAKAAENIENRKRKGRYTGFEDEDALGEKKGILSRYDEDDESNKKFFTLDSEVISVGDVSSEKQKKLDAMNPGKVKVSLEVDLPPIGIIQDSSDYMPAEQIKIKKPKKSKKSKNSRKRAAEEDEEDGRNQDAEMMDYQPDVIEDDDEDLQALLSKQRRSLQKKRKGQFLTPEMLAQTIRDNSTEGTPAPETDESGLVIDDMTEFVGNVGNSIAAEEEEERERKERLANSRRSATTPVKFESEDVAMADDHDEEQIKPEHENEGDGEVSTTGLEGEPVLSSIGLGATLSMLRSRGLLKTPDEQDLERQRIQRDNMKWRVSMAQHKARSELELRAQREADRKSGKYDKLTQKEREEAAQRENQMRQLVEAREAQKRFKDYKPEIKIEYKDEFGRVMGQKEAFKHLSHQFHGKGSGKGKTEKRLKKIEDERKKESSSLFS